MVREEYIKKLREIDSLLEELFHHYINQKTQELVDQKYTSETFETKNRISELLEERAQLIIEGLQNE